MTIFSDHHKETALSPRFQAGVDSAVFGIFFSETWQEGAVEFLCMEPSHFIGCSQDHFFQIWMALSSRLTIPNAKVTQMALAKAKKNVPLVQLLPNTPKVD